jgi:hypothetical protein
MLYDNRDNDLLEPGIFGRCHHDDCHYDSLHRARSIDPVAADRGLPSRVAIHPRYDRWRNGH